jgi:tetratricopeptide (TPR) repeat protein
MNRLAWLYAKKKTKLSKAQRLSRKAVKSDPQNHRYLDTLAEVYYVRGKKDKAIKTIKKALEIDGDNRLYKQQLWRFKYIKSTPKKTEITATSEPLIDSKSESTVVEDSSDDSNAVTPETETSEETAPEEGSPEIHESQPFGEEL